MPVTFWYVGGGGGGGEVVQGYTIHVHSIHACYNSPTAHIHLLSLYLLLPSLFREFQLVRYTDFS